MANIMSMKAEQAQAPCRGGLETGLNFAGAVGGIALRVAPVTGAVAGGLGAIRQATSAIHEGNVPKAVNELVAGAADTATSVFFGGAAGSAAREAVRQGMSAAGVSDDSLPNKSDIRNSIEDAACRLRQSSQPGPNADAQSATLSQPGRPTPLTGPEYDSSPLPVTPIPSAQQTTPQAPPVQPVASKNGVMNRRPGPGLTINTPMGGLW